MKYWDLATKKQERQARKGMREYGMALENNTEMDMEERLNMLEEELIDSIMYIEHILEAIKEKKNG